MKRLLYIIAALIVLASCKDKATQQAEEAKELADRFAPVINGAWVMTGYIEDLAKTKSPLASSEILKDIVSMEINTADYTGDSLYVAVSFNNHEGGGFMAYFRPGKNEQSITTALPDYQNSINSYELGYDIANGDTSLVLYHYGAGGKLHDKRSYSKVAPLTTENGEPSALQRATNNVLFAGSYTATDENGTTTDVSFAEDGIITGFEGHSTYYIFTDFIAEEEGYRIDEIIFDERTKNQKPFIFEISGDTTRLFSASENYERTQLLKGALKYTLTRKN